VRQKPTITLVLPPPQETLEGSIKEQKKKKKDSHWSQVKKLLDRAEGQQGSQSTRPNLPGGSKNPRKKKGRALGRGDWRGKKRRENAMSWKKGTWSSSGKEGSSQMGGTIVFSANKSGADWTGSLERSNKGQGWGAAHNRRRGNFGCDQRLAKAATETVPRPVLK